MKWLQVLFKHIGDIVTPSQQARFEGPVFTGQQGEHVYVYFPPNSGTPRYVTFLPNGHSFFSDSFGRPLSEGISTPSGAIIGGILGAFLGPIGALGGMLAGALAAELSKKR